MWGFIRRTSWLAWWVVVSSALVFAAQAVPGRPAYESQKTQTYHLLVEDRADMPLKILSAQVTSYPAGNLDIYLKVQNIGNRTVEAFSVLLPDGLRRYHSAVFPEGIAAFPEYNIQDQLAQTEYLASRGELSSLAVRVADVEFRQNGPTNSQPDTPIQMDLSAVSDSSIGVEVVLPSYPAYFLDRSGYPQPQNGLRVLAWVKTNLEIHNTSTESLRGIRYKFEEPADETWLSVVENTRLTEIAPGDTSVIGIIVPAEVFDHGAKRMLQKLRLVVTGVVAQPKDHDVVLTLVPQTGQMESGVDEMPAVLKSAGTSYTEEALRDKIEGVVRIKALIVSDGVVKRAMVTRHLPEGLDEQALAAIYGTRFKPALKDGHPVHFWQVIEVTFKL